VGDRIKGKYVTLPGMSQTPVTGSYSSYLRTSSIMTVLLILLLGMQGCGGGSLDSPDSHQYPRVAITTASLPVATVGTPYTFKMQATGGSGSEYLWGVQPGTLPTGMKFDLDGNLTGTPTIAGPSTLTFNVQHTCYCVPQNEPQSDSKALTLVVQ
jgi:hypothetical protein